MISMKPKEGGEKGKRRKKNREGALIIPAQLLSVPRPPVSEAASAEAAEAASAEAELQEGGKNIKVTGGGKPSFPRLF